jgi:protein SCO1
LIKLYDFLLYVVRGSFLEKYFFRKAVLKNTFLKKILFLFPLVSFLFFLGRAFFFSGFVSFSAQAEVSEKVLQQSFNKALKTEPLESNTSKDDTSKGDVSEDNTSKGGISKNQSLQNEILKGQSLYSESSKEENSKSENSKNASLQSIEIQEALGHQLDLSLLVTKENGERVPLKEFFHSQKPVVISFVYFNCPGLCGLHLNGVLQGLQSLDWTPGEEFIYLTISFDGRESPQTAQAKKQNYLKKYQRESAQRGWFFLTSTQPELDRITQTLGFPYYWDSHNEEWAHSSALIFLSPEGVVTRYLHGVTFEPEQIKLALSEASRGEVGTVLDKVVWSCFRYDSKEQRYLPDRMSMVSLGGGFLLLLFVFVLWILKLTRKG